MGTDSISISSSLSGWVRTLMPRSLAGIGWEADNGTAFPGSCIFCARVSSVMFAADWDALGSLIDRDMVKFEYFVKLNVPHCRT